MNKYQITVCNHETLETLIFNHYHDCDGDKCLLSYIMQEIRELGWNLSNVEINVHCVA